MNEDNDGRKVPISDLDFNYMVTDTVWGKQDINSELKKQLVRTRKVIIPKGERYANEKGEAKISDGTIEGIETESLWDTMAFYTQDMRLGYLNPWYGETKYCQYYLNLASDLLQERMVGAFIVALSKVATALELSQSNHGFLRRNMNTFTQKSQQQLIAPPKRSLFGKAPKETF